MPPLDALGRTEAANTIVFESIDLIVLYARAVIVASVFNSASVYGYRKSAKCGSFQSS